MRWSISRIIFLPIAVLLLFAGCMIMAAPAAALYADSTPSPFATGPPDFLVSCTSLTVTPGTDKRSYTFFAAAGGSANAITGYRFDYGDRQSYTVTLPPDTSANRLTVRVTHTYQKFGTYHASVQVLYSIANRPAAATSPDCKATVTFGPPVSTLPNTGVSMYALVPLIAATSIAAGIAWRARFRRLAAIHRP